MNVNIPYINEIDLYSFQNMITCKNKHLKLIDMSERIVFKFYEQKKVCSVHKSYYS